MLFSQVRQYIKGLLSRTFSNKSVLDKLNENDNKLTYNGDQVDDFDNLTNRPVKEVTSISDIITPLPVRQSNDFIESNGILWYKKIPLCAVGTVHIYINSATGVDDIDDGYGFSSAKPFQTLDYGFKYAPNLSTNSSQVKSVLVHLSGTFTADAYTTIPIEHYAQRIYVIIDSDTTLSNYCLQFVRCTAAFLRLNGNLTFNTTITPTSGNYAIRVEGSNLMFDTQTGTTQSPKLLTINGIGTLNNSINGFAVTLGGVLVLNDNKITLASNNCGTALSVMSCSRVYLNNMSGTNNTNAYSVQTGGAFAYNTFTATGAKNTSTGGRIYTGSQS